MLNNVWVALLLTLLVAFIWLRFMDMLAFRGVLSGPLSRKIIHSGTGPIFVLCWLLFPDVPLARYLAALVPLLITIQFFLIGSGLIQDEASVGALSRTGDPREILRGPLYYGIVFVIITVVYWRDSAVGIVALMLLCGGDGLADIVGKRFGKTSLPWSPKKTLQGSMGMFFGGFLFIAVVLFIYTLAGQFAGKDIVNDLPIFLLIVLIGTFVESIPINDIDNISVPLVSVLLSQILLR